MAPSRGAGGEGAEEEMAAAAAAEVAAAGDEAEAGAGSEVASSSSEVVWYWKQDILLVARLWCVGFRDACCLHRAYFICRRSPRVLKKTWQCFVLNGCGFLGSILILEQVVIPTLQWLLNPQLQDTSGASSSSPFIELVQNSIIGSFYVLWLYPLYLMSFLLNCLWYNEIAIHAFKTLDREGSGPKVVEPGTAGKGKGPRANRSKRTTTIESLVLGIGEQIYSVIMLSVFFVEVSAVSYVPVVGQLLKFILMSWLYAYYCFDYKWGLERWSLERRLLSFESNWAFFAGFGGPCVLATFFLSPLVGGGVMATVFPWFVLVATASDPEAAINACLGGKDSGLPRLHLFYFSNKLTVPLVRLFQTYWSPSAVRIKTK